DENTVYTWAETRNAVSALGTALAALPGGVLRRPVAVYMERGADALHAMLGVLAAGGLYTVLDTAQPPERVRAILGQLEPAVILTDAGHGEAARELAGPAQVVDFAAAVAAAPDVAVLAALRQQ